MQIKFPTFEAGTAATLLDSAEAKKVKAFIEAWNVAKITRAEKDSVSITDGNVLITYAGIGGTVYRVTVELDDETVVPSRVHLSDALLNVEFSSGGPQIGDVINICFREDGDEKLKFRATLSQGEPIDAADLWAIPLDYGDGVRWLALVVQTGLF